MILQDIVNQQKRIDLEAKNFFEKENNKDLMTISNILMDKNSSKIEKYQFISNLIELQKKFEIFEDQVVLLKILTNFKEAWLNVTKRDEGLSFLIDNKNKLIQKYFEELMVRGMKEDLKTLDKKYFIYSLKQMKEKKVEVKDIDYKYLNENWVKNKIRLLTK